MNERELPEVEPQIETVDPVDQVLDLLRDDETAAAIALVTDMRSPDAAEVLEHLSSDDLEEIIPSLDAETISGAIEYADSSTRSEIVRLLETDTLTETIAAVPDDIATDLVHELDDETAAQVMEGLSDERREELEQLLTYADDTAGGRMTGQVITLLPNLTAGQAIEQLRTSQADSSKPFYLYVTEPDRTLEGVLNVRALITAPPGSVVTELMTTDVITIEASEDQEEAARVLQRHNLLALPVVDQHGHLLGTITSDDLIDVMQEEATEDLYRLALVHEDEDLRGIASSIRNRLPWLTVNLVTALAAAWVVAFFESTLAQVAILAAFLPVIGGQGGNAGIQTLTIIVRSLAIDRVAPSPDRRYAQNPLMNSYRAADGKWLWLIGAEASRHWEPMMTALEATHLLADERFQSSRSRNKNAAALIESLDGIFARRSRDEWAAVFREHGVWWAPVNSFEDLVEDTQVQSIGAFRTMATMDGDSAEQRTLAAPIDFGSDPGGAFPAPPRLGADTRAVLEALGRHRRYIRGLISKRVTLKFSPDLHFDIDTRFDDDSRIDSLLRSPTVARDLDGEDD